MPPNDDEDPILMASYLGPSPPQPRRPWHRPRAQLHFLASTASRTYTLLNNPPTPHWLLSAQNLRQTTACLHLLHSQTLELLDYCRADLTPAENHSRLFRAVEALVAKVEGLSAAYEQLAERVWGFFRRGVEEREAGQRVFAAWLERDLGAVREGSLLDGEVRVVSEGLTGLCEEWVRDPLGG
ncbi:hypothetical protein MBLNU230_g6545t1 [Neophaeotheca triangularis]